MRWVMENGAGLGHLSFLPDTSEHRSGEDPGFPSSVTKEEVGSQRLSRLPMGHQSAVRGGVRSPLFSCGSGPCAHSWDPRSSASACVSEASDLFLSRRIPERPVMDLPHSPRQELFLLLPRYTLNGWNY